MQPDFAFKTPRLILHDVKGINASSRIFKLSLVKNPNNMWMPQTPESLHFPGELFTFPGIQVVKKLDCGHDPCERAFNYQHSLNSAILSLTQKLNLLQPDFVSLDHLTMTKIQMVMFFQSNVGSIILRRTVVKRFMLFLIEDL